MPAAFYRGYNSPQINSQAQNNTTSGNPGLVYNQPQPSDSMRGWAQMIPSDTRQQTMQNMANQQQQANPQSQYAAQQQQLRQGYTAPQMQQSNPGQQQSMANNIQQMQQSNQGQPQTGFANQLGSMQNGFGAGMPSTQSPMQFSLGNMAANYTAPNIDGQSATVQQSNPGTAQTMAAQTPWQQRQAASGNGGGYVQPVIRGQMTTGRGF